jgi:hypothetical protein
MGNFDSLRTKKGLSESLERERLYAPPTGYIEERITLLNLKMGLSTLVPYIVRSIRNYHENLT